MNAPRIALTLVLVACPAAASPTYPGTIESELKIRSLPVPGQGCLLCHQTESGGANTVVQPFGRSMRTLGTYGGNNTGSLVSALRAADAQGTDSDGDGMSDVDELRARRDPNVPQATADGGIVTPPEQPPLLETGCAVRMATGERAPQRAPLPATLVAASLLCMAGLRRSSARRHRHPEARQEHAP
jgi:hypothetical protein